MTATDDGAGTRVDWETIRREWELRPGVTYLNHGSFGPSPRSVIEAREAWSRRLEAEPMDFFVREMEAELATAADELGRFVGAAGEDLLFVPNATFAMNIVAANVRLRAGDQVLATNHEYGSVMRIWRDACRAAGAELVVRRLPPFLDSDEEIAATFLAGMTDKTRLIVVSHVTSPTAVALPVEAICKAARARGVQVCIDGPHAPAMVPVDLAAIGCDYYCASLHKWVCAPFGSGFLYVAPKHQTGLRSPITSWGGSISGREATWKDEFTWFGTYDPAAFLAVPTASRFLEDVGIERFRGRTHDLARYARAKILGVTQIEPIVADTPARYGSMIALPLPRLDGFEGGHGRQDPLQLRLWQEDSIEVPVMHWGGQRLLRVSCHLYNREDEIDRLAAALRRML
ncbi:MAG: aminotransferase class V-fold PLP-dependent enzyme [Planctomycetaceae bacterium]|nr:aminotransferase class V-fold PLP-dependent enzyme [Planctomycetaceae bacterium]